MVAPLIPVAAAVVAGAATHKPKKLKNIGQKKKSWLDSFTASAKPICEKNGVPYQMCVAQAALESGWGAKAPKFNHFGIKGSGSAGTQTFKSKEFKGGKYIEKEMNFAAYKSLEDGIQAYCDAMKNNPKFKYATEKFPTDFDKFSTWIWGKGYATDPNYVFTLLGVMSVIYRATGNEDFNKKLTPQILKVVNQLKKKEAGTQRSALTEKLLKEEIAA